MDKPDLLLLAAFGPAFEALMEQAYTVHRLHDAPDPAALLDEVGPRIRAAVGSGGRGLSGDEIARLPKLEIVALFGVGLDTMDMAAARARGIVVTDTPQVTADVADTALALYLAAVRRVIEADAWVRDGRWEAGRMAPPHRASGRKVGAFDRVIASEILEHIPDDRAAIAEIARVLRPGGLAVVTVPRRFPEQVCWWLSESYHTVEGGHVRIYKASALTELLVDAGLEPYAHHHAHALHSPYWWLKCAVGPDTDHALVRAYHRMLVWDIMKAPRLTRTGEKLLNPLLGKSVALYLRKPAATDATP